VVVNLDNPVENLTLTQLSSIYSGFVNNWKELGGPDLAVKPLAPDLFTSLLLEILRTDAAKFTSLPSNPALKASVAVDPGAVGFLPCKNLDSTLKVLAVNGVAPFARAGSGQNYPLMRPYFLLIPNTPSELITKWIDFVQNGKGKTAIEQAELETAQK
jgi:phosphate transport system substrate-binding protein